jgi:hypothetical protein
MTVALSLSVMNVEPLPDFVLRLTTVVSTAFAD